MANTYTQIHIQLVFVVKFRDRMISPQWKDELYRYISGIIKNNGHKPLITNGMPDHIHIFLGLRPDQSISNLAQKIKSNSSRWINANKMINKKFNWQQGYGAFSYSKSNVHTVIRYIKNQEEHHQKRSFREEYVALLKEFEVGYDEQYVFHDPL